MLSLFHIFRGSIFYFPKRTFFFIISVHFVHIVFCYLTFKHLEEALQVTAGSGVVGVGNPAYVLERLRILAEDDFMSAFNYDRGGG